MYARHPNTCEKKVQIRTPKRFTDHAPYGNRYLGPMGITVNILNICIYNISGMSMVLSKWILTPIQVGCKSCK